MRLVHVVHPSSGFVVPEALALDLEAADQIGREAIAAAAQRVGELSGDSVKIETVVQRGSTVDVLVELSRDSECVVLQHRRQSRARRILTGSVTSGVAARCGVSVVSVPEDWSPRLGAPRVSVGLDEGTPDSHLLDEAFATASRMGATLAVLHAWYMPAMYDDTLVDRTEAAQWSTRAEVSIAERLAPWRERYPEVPVDVVVLHMRPADALADASIGSDVLLLGHRGPHHIPHLGSIARAVLREARCPLVLVPAQRASESVETEHHPV
ncbi:universal stress protein [Nocardioides pacificus]